MPSISSASRKYRAARAALIAQDHIAAMHEDIARTLQDHRERIAADPAIRHAIRDAAAQRIRETGSPWL